MATILLKKQRRWWISAAVALCLVVAALLGWQYLQGEGVNGRGFSILSSTQKQAARAFTPVDFENGLQPVARLGEGRGTTVVFAPNGRQVAVATDIGLYLYDATTFLLTRFWATATPVQRVTFTADGAGIAFSTMSKGQKLYHGNPESESLTVLDLDESLIHGLAYSPDGAYLIGVSFYHLFIWDAATLELLVSHQQPSALTKQILFSPDGQLLAMLYKDTLELWQLDQGLLLETVTLPEGHYFSAEAAAFAPTGQQLVAGGLREPVLYTWALSAAHTLTEQPVKQLRERSGTIVDLRYNPTGDQLVVGFMDGTIHVFDPLAAEAPPNMLETATLDQVAWSTDGTLLATGITDGHINLWSVASMTITERLPLPSYAAAAKVDSLLFHAEGSLLMAATRSGAIYAWSTTDGALNDSLEAHSLGRLNSVAFTEDGTQLLVGGENGVVQFWERESGQLINTFHPPAGHVDAVRAAPDGSQFVVAASDALALGMWSDPAYLWEPQSDVPFTILDTDDSGFVTSCGIYWNSAVYSADGQYLATTAYAHKALLWRVADGALLHEIEGHQSAILDIAFSPDSSLLATASDDEEVRIWQIEDGALQQTFSGHAGGAVAVTFAPNGEMVATRSAVGDVVLWPLDDSHQSQLILTDVRNPRSNLVFSPDGNFLAIGGRGNQAYLWQVTKQAIEADDLYLLEAHHGLVNEVAFSPDGNVLATASDDGTVVLWDVPPATSLQD